MTDYERLRKQLKATPYVVADGATGEVKLVGRADALRLMTEAGPFPSQLIMDAGHALEQFSRLDGVGKTDREFGLREIAQIFGMSYNMTYHHVVKRRVFLPSIRPANGSGTGDCEARFSWSDGFVAGIAGSLRRHGLKSVVLRQIQPLFTTSTKKRTPRKSAAPARS